VLTLGAVIVPVHALLTAGEVEHVLKDSGSKLLVSAGGLLESALPAARSAGVPCFSVLAPGAAADDALDLLAAEVEPVAELVQRDGEDDAVVLYTSGTTGRCKGAALSQSNVVLNTTINAFDLFRVTVDDVFLGALPLFHTFGQTCVMNTAFRSGASLVLMPRFDGPSALDLMIREGVTLFYGVPTMYIGLLDAARRDERRPQLRYAAAGGSSLPIAVIDAFEATFNAPIFEGYGLTETSPVATFNQVELGRKPGTVGCAIWGVDVEIAQPDLADRIELLPPGALGEIVIRGHNVFKGYLNDPEATRDAIVDGWFRSGDLGTKDGDGFITIVDRKKDMIIRGGFNVYPREVEEVLMRHPAVRNAAVIGVPHETHGEEIVAVVIADGEGQNVDAEAIISWSQQHLAKHKYPRRVLFVDAMPLGPSGKVLKRELRTHVQ